MRKLVLTIFLILVSLVTIYFLSKKYLRSFATIPQGKTYEVVLTQDGFSPSELTIKPGDSIKFTTQLNEPFWPASDLHPTHGIYPEFDPLREIAPNESWSFRFTKSGRWKFHNHLQSMVRGIVIVK